MHIHLYICNQPSVQMHRFNQPWAGNILELHLHRVNGPCLPITLSAVQDSSSLLRICMYWVL